MTSTTSLPTVLGRADFWPRVSSAARLGLMLDYDGTLAPFHVDRYQATPYPGIADVLVDLRDHPAINLLLVSGRSALEVAQLLGVERIPIAGAHGFELLSASGDLRLMGLPTGGPELLAEAAAQAAACAPLERVEVKSASVAIHLRGLTPHDADVLRTAVLAAWETLDTRAISEVRHFNGGYEFRVRGRNKGDVVRDVLADLGGHGLGVFFGDDETDEDAFAAIRDRGIGVLVSPTERMTAATGRIANPASMLTVLTALRDIYATHASAAGRHTR